MAASFAVIRILVLTDLFPPAANGGYERECAAVVAHLRRTHDVLVVTGDAGRQAIPADPGVARSLPFLTGGRARQVLGAPVWSWRAATETRRLVASFRPQLAFVWGCVDIPHAAIAVLAEAGVPLAYRICLDWSTQVYDADRFMRELTRRAGGVRAPWGVAMRAVNTVPGLRLDALLPHRAGVSWASRALRDSTALTAAVRPVVERVVWPTTAGSERFAHRPRAPREDPAIVFLGRVVPDKGPDVAYRALAALRRRHGLTPRLLVVGRATTRYRRELDALARALGVAGQVTWLGPREHDEVGDLLAVASAMVLPSTAFDAFPLTMVEAAFARVPLVASDLGGIPEAVRHEREALLFRPGDPEDCAAKLADVLRRPAAAEDRARRAFERATRCFSHRRYLDATDEFLDATLAACHSSAASELSSSDTSRLSRLRAS